jgi:hypothetical protein
LGRGAGGLGRGAGGLGRGAGGLPSVIGRPIESGFTGSVGDDGGCGEPLMPVQSEPALEAPGARRATLAFPPRRKSHAVLSYRDQFPHQAACQVANAWVSALRRSLFSLLHLALESPHTDLFFRNRSSPSSRPRREKSAGINRALPNNLSPSSKRRRTASRRVLGFNSRCALIRAQSRFLQFWQDLQWQSVTERRPFNAEICMFSLRPLFLPSTSAALRPDAAPPLPHSGP